MNKINIMYLIGSLASGGAERQVTELARKLDKTKYKVFIVIYHRNIHFNYILNAEDITVVCIEKKFKLSPWFLFRLVNFIRKNRINIIHSHMHNTNVWARIAGKLSGCRAVITSIHSTRISPKYYLIERILKRWTARVITVSYITKQVYLEKLSLRDDDFVTVIQNGIDLDNIANCQKILPEEIRSRYDLKEIDFVIIHVAGIDRNKNQLCLLKAVKAVKIPNLKVLIVGRVRDSIYYQELLDYIKINNMEANILLLGEQQDVFSLMNISSLLVLTSLHEAFPMVIMEAMSMGLPVISSDVGDVRYLVKDGVNGFLFPIDDHQRLSKLIYSVYSLGDEERKRMGKAGREIIEANYSIEKIVKKTEAVYESCIDYHRMNNICK